MIDFPDELKESKSRFLQIVHASLPSDVSCLLSCDWETRDYRLMKSISEGDADRIDIKALACSSLAFYAIEHHIALCTGHIIIETLETGGDLHVRAPSSAIIIPFSMSDATSDLYCFYRFEEDAYCDRDLYFVRTMLKRFQTYLKHCHTFHYGIERGASADIQEDLGFIPYYLTNLLSAFLQASCRVLPLKALILTLWTDVVSKGEFLHVTGCSKDILDDSACLEKSQVMVRHLGTTFRVQDFHFFYRRVRFRTDIDTMIPRLPLSVSGPIRIAGKVVGTVTLKTMEISDRETMKLTLSKLIPLITWEMQIAKKRAGVARCVKGGDASIINSRTLQEELTNHYRFARRYGESLSAVIFRPRNPYRYTRPSEESFSRLFLLMRKSIRSVDSACLYGLNGFLILLPRARHCDAMKVAQRLIKLADEVIKHDEFLDRRTTLEYRVVSFPELAKNEVEFWEAISEAVLT